MYRYNIFIMYVMLCYQILSVLIVTIGLECGPQLLPEDFFLDRIIEPLDVSILPNQHPQTLRDLLGR